MKVLFVVTSHRELGNTGEKTGFWIEEFAAPYYVLTDAGVSVSIASPMGGQPPIDPKSEAREALTPATERYFKDKELQHKIAQSLKLQFLNHQNYDAVFYPGGHGPMWDLVKDKSSIELIESFYNNDKPIAFVCHAPAALLHAKAQNGKPLISGKNLTAFSNTEEAAVKLTNVVPFLLEDELVKKGALYCKGDDWTSYTEQDGLLITGQNPASSGDVAKLLLQTLIAKKQQVPSYL